MTGTLVSDVSITLTQRRWACVLDPALALSVYGLPLVKQLSDLMELWIVRDFWHMLDNPQFYVEQPEALLEKQIEGLPLTERQEVSQQMLRSLQEWERLRLRVDPATRNLNFLTDVMGDSYVPPGVDGDLFWRWESLAQGLDSYLQGPMAKANAAMLAYRDLAALAAARPACILTLRSGAEAAQNQLPRLCSILQQWQIPCREIDPQDPHAALERDHLRRVLVHAGVAKLLWAGLHLVVLHLVVPGAATVSSSQDWADDYGLGQLAEPSPDVPLNLWKAAAGFWYVV